MGRSLGCAGGIWYHVRTNQQVITRRCTLAVSASGYGSASITTRCRALLPNTTDMALFTPSTTRWRRARIQPQNAEIGPAKPGNNLATDDWNTNHLLAGCR